ncbi:zeta toxin family protein [Methylomonas sp. UP202]|uniref:zeta toxin family protein n=1 Tax=Methylomonas sp. UP202 TaxID=3040943 RepID=UPI0024796322|nr:zeta toxin family protein [Methylomonas sp. UP202]WGS86098.1 zeta toxin family protein [Methylomonas sp. UP202]
MNSNPGRNIPAYRQLKRLRTALAVAQGVRLQAKLAQELEATVSHDQTKRVTYLTSLFTRIHREMFSDWKEQVTVHHRPGTMPEADCRTRFRIAIESLVLDGDDNLETALFDNNGFVVCSADIADRLAKLYQALRGIRPYGYGNRITLDFFITALGNLPAFKAVYEQGIDFRRLSCDDARALHDPAADHAALRRAFEHALDPARTQSLSNQANRYGKWPENKYFLQGLPFLSYTTADGVKCLVTVTGGLVPLSSIRAEEFITGQHFVDNPLGVSEYILGYLPGTEDLRQPGKTEIDAIPIRADGVAPLFCLDINILTSLRPPSHAELLDLLKQCAGEQASLFTLAGNEPLKNKMLAASHGENRLMRTVEIAYQRLTKIDGILSAILEAIFAGKAPVERPTLFMCMGGAGAGKTAVEEIAKAQCGDNFVIASLDEFRKLSDLYRLLTAADHHSDDYVYVEPFANRLRDLVAEQARLRRINILYDGTAIPYQPRYSTIVQQYHAAGFNTRIVAVDAFLVKPAGREQELSRAGVIGSVTARFETTGRALPWVVTIDKHIRSPHAFLLALADAALDKLALFANDGERDRHYLVAESFVCGDDEVRAMQRHQLNGSLAQHWRALVCQRPDSVLKNLAADNAALDALIARNPALNEDNVGYLIYAGSETNRVLAIYHLRRLVDFVQKRQLNPNASGEDGLLHKPAALAFHVDPAARESWITRLQGSVE